MAFNSILTNNYNSIINVNPGISSDAIPVRSKVAIDSLPNELSDIILGNVHPDDLGRLSQVSTLWNQKVNKIPADDLRVFGADAWEKLGYIIEGEIPPIPSRINQITRSDRRRFAGKNGALSFILMPKGLTFNILNELMKNKGIELLGCYQTRVISQLGNKAIEESYWCLMTNDLVEGSNEMTYSDQKELIAQKSESQCRLSTFLETVAVWAMIKCSKCSQNSPMFPRTHYWNREIDVGSFAHCQDEVNDEVNGVPVSHPVSVGANRYGNLNIDEGLSQNRTCIQIGVLACRKFCRKFC